MISKRISELGPLAVLFWRMGLYTGLVALFLWANRTSLASGFDQDLVLGQVLAAGAVSVACRSNGHTTWLVGWVL